MVVMEKTQQGIIMVLLLVERIVLLVVMYSFIFQDQMRHHLIRNPQVVI